jgi:hypothetical protein
VKGTFVGNGKSAKLAFVSAQKGNPFADKETVMLVFSEKDHSKAKKPDMEAAFGHFGSALLITIYPDTGKIVGCEVAHAAHQQPFSSLGSMEIKDFTNEGGVLSGRIATDGKVETFRQTWDLDITFRVKAP